jgi:hypothetical protein
MERVSVMAAYTSEGIAPLVGSPIDCLGVPKLE